LVSRTVDHERLFRLLRIVIVDEVHAFAGDDRGWHLLSLLGRIDHLAERPPIQRIALSASLANPKELLDWFSGRPDAPRQVVAGVSSSVADADVQVDSVGSLSNAATVISRLHRGEKRLVFTDSRSAAEQLAQELRSTGVETYVSHSSIGLDDRQRAESAFAAGRDCVIVATSTLELGIDVGDLDRVIQIDAPGSVASFLQRLGRSGRRASTRRNCLILATDDESLLRALGIVLLWSEGWVEPVVLPPAPWNVVAQQVLATVLQEGARGISRSTLRERLASFLETAGLSSAAFGGLVWHLLNTGILAHDDGVLGIGTHGERAYGARHFLEVFSVFQLPPLMPVIHGVSEIGQVHDSTFRRNEDEPLFITLAGQSWRVTHVDWQRRRAYVQPSDAAGRSRWIGEGPTLSHELAQAVRRVLVEGVALGYLSARSRDSLQRLQGEFSWLRLDRTIAVFDRSSGHIRWWTFAGDSYNQTVGEVLRDSGRRTIVDGIGLTIENTGVPDDSMKLIVRARDSMEHEFAVKEPAGLEERVKFVELLPPLLRRDLVSARLGKKSWVKVAIPERIEMLLRG
jgi:ATP-dependent helicase Lhr and Lhr-like helicase